MLRDRHGVCASPQTTKPRSPLRGFAWKTGPARPASAAATYFQPPDARKIMVASFPSCNRRMVAAILFIPWLAFAMQVQAQVGAPPLENAADPKWTELQTSLAALAPGKLPAPQNREAAEQGRRQLAAGFLRTAGMARAFSEGNPMDPRAGEARLIEARSLLQAAMAGDSPSTAADPSREARVRALVDEVRRDRTMPVKTRYDLVALSEVVRLRPLLRNRVEFLKAREQSAHGLIAEFPGEAGGYEVLLQLAENHPDDAEGERVAREIGEMPAPESVKVRARCLVERQALVGRSLLEIARVALGEDNAIVSARGQGIILYTWATTSPGSISAAKFLTGRGPVAGVRLIGLNLDRDVEAARAAARNAGLPGEQICDPRGLEGPLAQALKLNRPGEVYVASPQGELRSVSASRGDLTAKLGSAGHLTGSGFRNNPDGADPAK